MSDKSTFVYVTYIRTTPEKLWDALLKPEFNRQYWLGCHQESTWKAGASWKLMIPDGRVCDSGSVVEIEPRRRLVLRWKKEFKKELMGEGYSTCTFELEESGDMVKLTVTHEMDVAKSKLIDAVSKGWPGVLSGLKSLLETGDSLEAMKHWPKGI